MDGSSYDEVRDWENACSFKELLKIFSFLLRKEMITKNLDATGG
jgi:hypothetical protein